MNQTNSMTVSEISLGKPHKVILFNDDDHDMQEVAVQIMKAIKCGIEHAFSLMLEAHKNGRTIVFTGCLERCEHVDCILAEINLATKIEPA